MKWMINTQLGRRNLLPGQRLAVIGKFKKKIQEQATTKKEESDKQFYGNRYTGKLESSPSGEQSKCKLHTDKEMAKLAGVGTGTVARYNRVMNSDNEELKKDVKTGKITVNTAYEKVREQERQKENKDNKPSSSQPKTYQEAAQLYGGMQQGHLPNRKAEEKNIGDFTDEQLVDALISTKTLVNVLDSIVPKQEFDIMIKTQLGGNNCLPDQRLAANFGRSKNDDKKQRKVAVEYVRLCGYKQGDNQWSVHNGLTLDEIAKQLGTSKTNLKRALSIERNLTAPMKELLDTGVISKTLASDVIASLSEDEQEELISKLDVTKTYTQKQTQKDIKDLIESNLRQRVVGNANPIKLGRCFQFLNDWYGFERGGDGSNQYVQKEKIFPIANGNEPTNQSELAESYNVTKQTMNNYMRLANAIPELDELIQTGVVTKSTALAMMKSVSCLYSS